MYKRSIVPLALFLAGLSVAALFLLVVRPCIGQGAPPQFVDLVFPAEGATIERGETAITGKIIAPNGLSLGPVLRINNLTLNSWDWVRLDIEGEDHYFDIYFEWPEKIIQSGQVLLQLTATDDLGLETIVQSHITVTPDATLHSLLVQRADLARQRGAEISNLYGQLSIFLADVPGFAFDSGFAEIMGVMVAETSASGRGMRNPWQPHIQDAINTLNVLNAPDPVAQTVKGDTLYFLECFFEYSEFTNNNFWAWVPAPATDIPLYQDMVDAYAGLTVTANVGLDVAHFEIALEGQSLFSLDIDKSVTPVSVEGFVHGVPLNDDEKLHPVLATSPIVDDIYMNDRFDLFRATLDKGGV